VIISRTPYRISFFGGGTDYPAWYQRHGGAVLGASIDKYCYLTCRHLPPFFEHRYRIVYSKIESRQTVAEIAHPSVRAVFTFLGVERGMEIHHDGDLPARSGMGSSSAFTVGLLHAVHALQGRMPSRHELASQAIHVEQQLLSESVGSQDQVFAAFGGVNRIQFGGGDNFAVQPVTVTTGRLSELSSHLLLMYTGIIRTASDIASSYVNDLDDKRRDLRIIRDMVDEALGILASGRDLDAFGELLHESWLVKRGIATAISNPRIDEIYEVARRAGALGGKLTGAGGGGFMLLFAPPETHAEIRARLPGLLAVPFKFDFGGSQIIFIDRERDYQIEEGVRDCQDIAAFAEIDERTAGKR
jgi:D-glycero-alpha-D-manno-heptose-7-phosphate kinase